MPTGTGDDELDEVEGSRANPWPDFELDTQEPPRVWREWHLELASDVDSMDAAAVCDDGDMTVVADTLRTLFVRIRSDDPATCDSHQVMTKTREVLDAIDRRWPIVRLQGVDKSRWLFLR